MYTVYCVLYIHNLHRLCNIRKVIVHTIVVWIDGVCQFTYGNKILLSILHVCKWLIKLYILYTAPILSCILQYSIKLQSK